MAGEVALRRIEREPLGELAHTQLRDALLGGRFAPGSTLTLRHLAETFGVSVTPVRDAVSRLVAFGVLELGPRGAAVVPDVKIDALAHITMVRTELEGRAAFEAATRAGRRESANLATQLDAMRAVIRAQDFATYLDLHRRFHFSVYALAEVPILSGIIENLWLRAGPVLSLVVPDYVLTLKGTDRHAAIVDAIARGDGALARKETAADIVEADAYLRSLAGPDGRIRRA